MALIHWWPLNGDKFDKITGSELISTSSTFAEGKIGRALQLNSIIAKTANPFIGLNDWSLSFWVMDNGSGAWSDFLCFSKNLIRIELDSSSSWRWYIGQAGTGATYPETGNLFSSGTLINGGAAVNTWYHVAIVKSGVNAQLYINSILKTTTASAINFTDESAMMYFNSRATETTSSKMSLNDVRCYDHALSLLEVKELSKALVVHYTFNDTLAEGTTNILNGVWSHSTFREAPLGAYTNFSNQLNGGTIEVVNFDGQRCLHIHSNGDRNRCFQLISTQAGKTYTISLNYYSSVNNLGMRTERNGGDYIWSSTQTSYTTPGNWARLSTTVTNTSDTTLYIFLMAKEGTDAYINDIQVEEKDHATLYTSTSRESMLANEAGYGGNGVLYNSSLSTDTASGTLSCHTPRINPSNVNTIVSPSNAAYVYADVFGYNHTPTEFTVAWWWKVIEWGYGTGPFGLVISNGDYMNSTLGVHDGYAFINFAGGDTRIALPFTCGLNSWNHFAITYKPGEAISYVNGVKQTTHTPNASLTLDPWRYLYLGAGCAGGALRDGDIYWGDFRYYSTALSADDISRLYHTKAYVSDQGDFFAGEFIEHADKARVKENYVVECSSLSDGLPHGYARLEYLESNGNQFIDTEFVPNQDTRVRAEVVLPIANATQACFGCRVSSKEIQYQFVTQGNMYRTDYNLTYVYMTPASTYAPTGKIFVDKNKNYTNINNDYSHTHAYETFTAPGNLYVFATNAKDKDMDAYAKATMKLYDMQIYDNGKLIRNYFPSINPSGVPGLYDTVNSVFYASKTPTPFIAGPILMTGKASLLEDGGVGGREIIEV